MKKLMFPLWIGVLASPIFSFSQSQDLPDPEPTFIAVIVSDIEHTISWYTKNLGMKILNRVENSERGFKQANLQRGNFLLEILEIDNVTVPDQKVGGYFKFGFTVERFDQWVEVLRKNGVDFQGSVVKDPSTSKLMLIIKDPDGNRIQIFEK